MSLETKGNTTISDINGSDNVKIAPELERVVRAAQEVALTPIKQDANRVQSLRADSVKAGSYNIGDNTPHEVYAKEKGYNLNILRQPEWNAQLKAIQTGGEVFANSMAGFGNNFIAGFIENFGANDPSELYELYSGGGDIDGNFLTRWAKNIQEHSAKHNHIFTTEEDDSLFDATYWANQWSNFGYTAGILAETFAEQAILSALTTYTGGAGAVVQAGRLAQVASRLAKYGRNIPKFLGKFGTSAGFGVLQGFKETYINSKEVKEHLYNELISKGVDPEVANQKASEAAAHNARIELAPVLALNALQFGGLKMLGKTVKNPFNLGKHARFSYGVSNTIEDATKGLFNRLNITNKFAKGTVNFLAQATSESLEEAWQEGTSNYAKYKKLEEMGLEGPLTEDESIYNKRFFDAMVGGFFGGAMFFAGGKAFNAVSDFKNREENKAKEEAKATTLNNIKGALQSSLERLAKRNTQDPDERRAVLTAMNRNNVNAAMSFDYQNQTTDGFDSYVATIDSAIEAVEANDSTKLKEMGMEGVSKEELIAMREDAINAKKMIAEEYNKTDDDFEIAMRQVGRRQLVTQLGERLEKSKRKLEELKAQRNYEGLSQEEKSVYDKQIELAKLEAKNEEELINKILEEHKEAIESLVDTENKKRIESNQPSMTLEEMNSIYEKYILNQLNSGNYTTSEDSTKKIEELKQEIDELISTHSIDVAKMKTLYDSGIAEVLESIEKMTKQQSELEKEYEKFSNKKGQRAWREKQIAKQREELNKKIEAINANDKLTPDEKKEAINKLLGKKKSLLDRIKSWKNTKKKKDDPVQATQEEQQRQQEEAEDPFSEEIIIEETNNKVTPQAVLDNTKLFYESRDSKYYYIKDENGHTVAYERATSTLPKQYEGSESKKTSWEDIENDINTTSDIKLKEDKLDKYAEEYGITLTSTDIESKLNELKSVVNHYLDMGNTVDSMVREYFMNGKQVAKPEGMSDEVYLGILQGIHKLDAWLQNEGLTAVTEQAVLWNDFGSKKVAGEVDVLLVNAEGNIVGILDIKTSKYGLKSSQFSTPRGKAKFSTKDKYTYQLSTYKDLLRAQYGTSVDRLHLAVFHIEGERGNITSVKGFDISENLPYKRNVSLTQVAPTPIMQAQIQQTLQEEESAKLREDLSDMSARELAEYLADMFYSFESEEYREDAIVELTASLGHLFNTLLPSYMKNYIIPVFDEDNHFEGLFLGVSSSNPLGIPGAGEILVSNQAIQKGAEYESLIPIITETGINVNGVEELLTKHKEVLESDDIQHIKEVIENLKAVQLSQRNTFGTDVEAKITEALSYFVSQNPELESQAKALLHKILLHNPKLTLEVLNIVAVPSENGVEITLKPNIPYTLSIVDDGGEEYTPSKLMAYVGNTGEIALFMKEENSTTFIEDGDRIKIEPIPLNNPPTPPASTVSGKPKIAPQSAPKPVTPTQTTPPSGSTAEFLEASDAIGHFDNLIVHFAPNINTQEQLSNELSRNSYTFLSSLLQAYKKLNGLKDNDSFYWENVLKYAKETYPEIFKSIEDVKKFELLIKTYNSYITNNNLDSNLLIEEGLIEHLYHSTFMGSQAIIKQAGRNIVQLLNELLGQDTSQSSEERSQRIPKATPRHGSVQRKGTNFISYNSANGSQLEFPDTTSPLLDTTKYPVGTELSLKFFDITVDDATLSTYPPNIVAYINRIKSEGVRMKDGSTIPVTAENTIDYQIIAYVNEEGVIVGYVPTTTYYNNEGVRNNQRLYRTALLQALKEADDKGETLTVKIEGIENGYYDNFINAQNYTTLENFESVASIQARNPNAEIKIGILYRDSTTGKLSFSAGKTFNVEVTTVHNSEGANYTYTAKPAILIKAPDGSNKVVELVTSKVSEEDARAMCAIIALYKSQMDRNPNVANYLAYALKDFIYIGPNRPAKPRDGYIFNNTADNNVYIYIDGKPVNLLSLDDPYELVSTFMEMKYTIDNSKLYDKNGNLNTTTKATTHIVDSAGQLRVVPASTSNVTYYQLIAQRFKTNIILRSIEQGGKTVLTAYPRPLIAVSSPVLPDVSPASIIPVNPTPITPIVTEPSLGNGGDTNSQGETNQGSTNQQQATTPTTPADEVKKKEEKKRQRKEEVEKGIEQKKAEALGKVHSILQLLGLDTRTATSFEYLSVLEGTISELSNFTGIPYFTSLHRDYLSVYAFEYINSLGDINKASFDSFKTMLKGKLEEISDKISSLREEIEKGTVGKNKVFKKNEKDAITLTKALDTLDKVIETLGSEEALTSILSEASEMLNKVTEGRISISEDAISEGRFEDVYTFDDNDTHVTKTSLTAEIRRMLSGSTRKKYMPDGTTVEITGLFGLTEYIPFGRMFDIVEMSLSIPNSAESSYEDIIQRLTNSSKFYPELRDVIEKLEKSSQQDKNAFMYAMVKAYNESIKEVKTHNGTKIVKANGNLGIFKLLEKWEYNFDSLMRDNGQGVDLSFIEDFNTKLDKIQDLVYKEGITIGELITPVQDLLATVGIMVDEEAVLSLLYNGVPVRSFSDVIRGKEGSARRLEDMLKRDKDTGVFSVKNSNFILYLANSLYNIREIKGNYVSEQHNPFRSSEMRVWRGMLDSVSSSTYNSYAKSYRDGGKVVSSFVYTRYANDAISRLKDKRFRTMLANSPYSGNSMLLQLLEDEVYQELFALNPFAVNATNSVDGVFTELSEANTSRVQRSIYNDVYSLPTEDVMKSVLDRYGLIGGDIVLRRMIMPTMSDKKQTFTLMLPTISDNFFSRYIADGVDKLANILLQEVVYPELKRIIHYRDNKGNVNINIPDIAMRLFYFLPELNNLSKPGNNNEREFLIDYLNTDANVSFGEFEQSDWKDAILNYLKGYIHKAGYNTILEVNTLLATAMFHTTIIGDIAFFAEKIDKSIKGGYIGGEFSSISNGEVMPDGHYTSIVKGMNVGTNLGKRLAMMSAQGNKLADSKDDTYIQLFLDDYSKSATNISTLIVLNDKNGISEEADKLIKKVDTSSEDYNEEEAEKAKKRLAELYPFLKDFLYNPSTDAQEYTTAKEHIDILFRQGRLEDRVYEVVKKKLEGQTEDIANGREISAGNTLTQKELGAILQPLKPVYTGTIWDESIKGLRTMYIKSSSFPLIPQLVYGTELFGMMSVMESIQHSTGKNVRASYGSANKVGAPKKVFKAWDANGSFVQDVDINAIIRDNTIELSRDNFRIQLDVPIKETNHVAIFTQLQKILFGDGVMDNDFTLDGKKFTGKEMWREYNDILRELISLKRTQLHKEFGLTPGGSVVDKVYTVNKIREVILEEGKSKGLTSHELSYITQEVTADNFEEFLYNIGLNTSTKTYESLLISYINKRIYSIKMPGYSYVAASEIGFKVTNSTEGVDKSKIIYTSKWTGELKSFEYSDVNDTSGDYSYAQVLMPSKFRDNEGKLIEFIHKDGSINETYVEKDPDTGALRLKEDMIDSELLKFVSCRIPTSSLISTAVVEIVGILPPEAGDLIIVPTSFTTQKGLDFDIDKEYLYSSYSFIDDEGRIKKYSNPSMFSEVGKVFTSLRLREGGYKLKGKTSSNQEVVTFSLTSPINENNAFVYTYATDAEEGTELASISDNFDKQFGHLPAVKYSVDKYEVYKALWKAYLDKHRNDDQVQKWYNAFKEGAVFKWEGNSRINQARAMADVFAEWYTYEYNESKRVELREATHNKSIYADEEVLATSLEDVRLVSNGESGAGVLSSKLLGELGISEDKRMQMTHSSTTNSPNTIVLSEEDKEEASRILEKAGIKVPTKKDSRSKYYRNAIIADRADAVYAVSNIGTRKGKTGVGVAGNSDIIVQSAIHLRKPVFVYNMVESSTGTGQVEGNEYTKGVWYYYDYDTNSFLEWTANDGMPPVYQYGAYVGSEQATEDTIREAYSRMFSILQEGITDFAYAVEGRLVEEYYQLSSNELDSTEKALKNRIVDITKAVVGSSNPDIQQKMARALSMDFAKEQADLLGIADNSAGSINSWAYQSYKAMLGAVGKMGIGVYSNAVVTTSLMQQYNGLGGKLHFKLEEDNGGITEESNPIFNFTIKSGNVQYSYNSISDSYGSKIRTMDGKRTIAEVLAERQNTATDNEKVQIMGRLNINKHTIGVDTVLTIMGFDQMEVDSVNYSIPYLILSDPLIREYCKEKDKNPSLELEKFISKKKISISSDGTIGSKHSGTLDLSVLTKGRKEYEKSPDSFKDYVEDNAEAYLVMMSIFKQAQEISDIMLRFGKLINAQSYKLGSNFTEAYSRFILREEDLKFFDRHIAPGLKGYVEQVTLGNDFLNASANIFSVFENTLYNHYTPFTASMHHDFVRKFRKSSKAVHNSIPDDFNVRDIALKYIYRDIVSQYIEVPTFLYGSVLNDDFTTFVKSLLIDKKLPKHIRDNYFFSQLKVKGDKLFVDNDYSDPTSWLRLKASVEYLSNDNTIIGEYNNEAIKAKDFVRLLALHSLLHIDEKYGNISKLIPVGVMKEIFSKHPYMYNGELEKHLNDSIMGYLNYSFIPSNSTTEMGGPVLAGTNTPTSIYSLIASPPQAIRDKATPVAKFLTEILRRLSAQGVTIPYYNTGDFLNNNDLSGASVTINSEDSFFSPKSDFSTTLNPSDNELGTIFLADTTLQSVDSYNKALHEVIHALSYLYLGGSENARKHSNVKYLSRRQSYHEYMKVYQWANDNIDKIKEGASPQLQALIDYALRNEHELIATVLTNKELQKHFNNIKVDDQSLLRKICKAIVSFLEEIASYLGVAQVNEGSLLEAILDTSLRSLDEHNDVIIRSTIEGVNLYSKKSIIRIYDRKDFNVTRSGDLSKLIDAISASIDSKERVLIYAPYNNVEAFNALSLLFEHESNFRDYRLSLTGDGFIVIYHKDNPSMEVRFKVENKAIDRGELKVFELYNGDISSSIINLKRTSKTLEIGGDLEYAMEALGVKVNYIDDNC